MALLSLDGDTTSRANRSLVPVRSSFSLTSTDEGRGDCVLSTVGEPVTLLSESDSDTDATNMTCLMDFLSTKRSSEWSTNQETEEVPFSQSGHRRRLER